MTRQTLQPYLWMLTSSFAFSWMGVLTYLAGAGNSWQVVALVRALVPLVLVVAWAKLDGVRLVVWGPPVLWLRSIAGSCSLVATFYALTHLPTSEVFTVSNVFPIWVALLSWPLLGEIPSPAIWISVACGVAGVVLVQSPGADGFDPTILLVVAASVFTALAMMGLHHLKDLDPSAVVVHFSGVATVFCVIALLVAPAAVPDAESLLLLVGVGVAATVGQFFLTKAFAAGAPARVSVVSLTQVVFVMALETVLLDRALDLTKLLGAVLIMAPTAWIMLRKPAPKPIGAPTTP